MIDAAEQFRARLAEELRTAFAAHDRAAIRTLRCIMAAVDNSGAISRTAQAAYVAASITEAPRKPLSEQAIAEILLAEISARRRAADLYERAGNVVQVDELRTEIATIEHLTTLLR